MLIQLIHTIKIIPYARNPRRNEKAVDKVAASIKEFGFRQPIVVDPEMVVIAGHTRLEAAQKLGLEEVPVHVAEGLTDQQIKAYRIADNRVSQEAEWDLDLLSLELKDLEGFDLSLTGFESDEINNALGIVKFEPASLEDQGQLDKLEPFWVSCPECGQEFDAKA